MEKGLAELGFWLGLGIVIAAMVIAGALKDRDKEREKQATLRALLDRDAEGTTQVLAYLREKDTAKREKERRETPIGLAIAAAVTSFIFGFFVLVAKPIPPPRFPFRFPGDTPPLPPPEAISHVTVAFVIWAAGIILTALILYFGLRGTRKNGTAPHG